MQVFSSVEAAGESGSLVGGALAIGNFDGVHLGHRRLCETAMALATGCRAKSALLTFEPHPVRILRPTLDLPLLTPLSRKVELLSDIGVDALIAQPFDSAFAQTSADAFVARDLAERLRVLNVVVGQDFTAGHERAPVDTLRTIMSAHGMTLHVVGSVAVDGLRVSSTRIRKMLSEGDVETAATLLARAHDVEGVVERGSARGRCLGFPTANVRPAAMLPANGVYAVEAHLGGSRYGGICDVGVKPTFGQGGPILLEVHLFDHDDRDLHGESIRVEFLKRIRGEYQFSSVDALRAQIANDVEAARRVLHQRAPA